ncbi:tryptophan synthase beta subunit-like PLP-dependent enzyme [Xylariaceae sp. AK1471]|nr:tryptophan synthase beta subunit-like PLP-dependent enzyme [Xylariaceae sp. AK1471]
MAQSNYLNVYKGPEAVRQYFDPDSTPPLPLVEIPKCLNPYYEDGVRIYAKMMTMHPANNVKCMPAMNLLEKSVVPGKTSTIVEYSSGSTVISMSLVARAIYGISDTRAFLSNKTSDAKLKLMKFFGLNLTLFGGPSQPEPVDERGGIQAAQRIAKEAEDTINSNQYENDDNWKSHVRWTGPQILKQLPEINLICAGMGTSGVCTAAGDRVPGPRSYALLAPVEFPWRESTDHIEHVGSYDSYSLSLDLCRQGIICGPSSGFNLKGLLQYIEKCKADGSLVNLAGPSGEIHCVFLCCDLPYQYIEEYYEKLEDQRFPPIKHEELTKVDKYRYDEAWERDYADVLQDFFEVKDMFSLICNIRSSANLSLRDILVPKADVSVIDLRQPSDYAINNLPGSSNLPTALPADASPFSSPAVMTAVWTRLENTFSNSDEDLLCLLQKKRILLICYDGDSARVATSVLRVKGYVADSLRGGFANFSPLNLHEVRDAEVGTWLKKTHTMKLDSREYSVSEAGLPPTPPSLSNEEGL